MRFRCWQSGAAEDCGSGGVAWMLSAGPTPSDSVVCLAFMSFRLTHPPTQSQWLPAQSCSVPNSLNLAMTLPQRISSNIWRIAPSTAQRRASLLSEVEPRDHLFPSLQKRKGARRWVGMILTTWMVQYSWKLKVPN